jgi:hypothetical protein
MDTSNAVRPRHDPVPLNGTEEAFWRCGLRLAVLCRVDGCIEEEFLEEALRRVEHRHPKLRATPLVDNTGVRRYHLDPPAPPIPWQIVEADAGAFPWREETRRLVATPHTPGAPLAAVTVLRDRAGNRADLILAVHHAVADGRSTLVLLDDLLGEYARAEAGDAPLPERAPIVSEGRAVSSAGWLDRARIALRFARLQLTERPGSQTPLPLDAAVPPFTQWSHFVFSRSDTLAIIRRCRAEQVSLNAALIAAACCALAECLGTAAAVFKWHSAFDVRDAIVTPRGPVGTRDLGCFMTLMRGRCGTSSAASQWDIARDVDGDIQDFARHGGPQFGFNMVALAMRRGVGPTASTPVNRNRPTLFATNYGVLELRDAYGTLRPRECTLVFTGDEITGASLSIEALVLGQRLNVGFVSNGVDSRFWDRLNASFRKHIESAAAVPRTPPVV